MTSLALLFAVLVFGALPWPANAEVLRPRISILLSVGGLEFETSQKVQSELAKEAHDALGASADLRIIYAATAVDLAGALLDEANEAIVYVSHASARLDQVEALGDPGQVVRDFYGRDVLPILGKVRPRLKSFSLVACDGIEILRRLRDNGFMADARLLSSAAGNRGSAEQPILFAPKGNAILKDSYSVALANLRDLSKRRFAEGLDVGEFVEFEAKILNASNENHFTGLLSIQDYPVALVAGGGTAALRIPRKFISGSTFLLRFDPHHRSEPTELPLLEFSGQRCAPVTVDGRPIGRGFHVYNCKIPERN